MTAIEERAVNLVRGFAMDAPLAAKSGHQGTAMALAPLAHVLFHRVMTFDPADPAWPDRDRFVLSNGHASILLYSELFMSGYDMTIDDLMAFRQWGSRTPGHPEAGHTPGVEVTTGPLGQGFANAVGMAVAEQSLRTRFGSEIMDHHIFAIAGDGCLMEGISHEAASLAGHLGLGRLVVVYDDNHITIDGPTSLAFTDNTPERFRGYGWHVEELGEIANDMDALEAALRRGMAEEDRPSLLVLRSHIAWPSPKFTDDHEAHGNPFTPDEVARTKEILGMPPGDLFQAPDDVVQPMRRAAQERGAEAHAKWQARLDAWDGDRAAWDACWDPVTAGGWREALPHFEMGEQLATRQALAKVLTAVAPHLPGLLSGAADLTGNTGVKVGGFEHLSADRRDGRQISFGVREHGMGAALNGMALHGGVLPVGGTFFVFSDYLRPALRLAALSRAPALYVFSHDSVGVGEDGPTHQPVEQLMSLRLIPDLHVIRPADANETAAAFEAAVLNEGPTALILTRQVVPVCTDGSAVARGAGTVRQAADPDIVLVGTGSEVHVCLAAADQLAADGISASVVSLPSFDRFGAQPAEFREEVLPPGVPVLSVEAGATLGWERYADDSIGIDRFGASAPGDVVLDKLGINVDHVVRRARALVSAD